MDKKKAMEGVIELSRTDNPGGLTTLLCESLDISFESFLKFSKLDSKGQLRVIDSLADMFELKLNTIKMGHGGI